MGIFSDSLFKYAREVQGKGFVQQRHGLLRQSSSKRRNRLSALCLLFQALKTIEAATIAVVRSIGMNAAEIPTSIAIIHKFPSID